MPPSVSGSDLVLDIGDRSRVDVTLKRHLAPRTVGILLRSLPIEGNVHFMGRDAVYLESALDSGSERARRDFKRGDIAFHPVGRSICFFVRDASPGRPMSPMGRIESDVELLLDARLGDVLRLHRG